MSRFKKDEASGATECGVHLKRALGTRFVAQRLEDFEDVVKQKKTKPCYMLLTVRSSKKSSRKNRKVTHKGGRQGEAENPSRQLERQPGRSDLQSGSGRQHWAVLAHSVQSYCHPGAFSPLL